MHHFTHLARNASALPTTNRWQWWLPVDSHFELTNTWIWDYHRRKYNLCVQRAVFESSAVLSLVRDDVGFLGIIVTSPSLSWASYPSPLKLRDLAGNLITKVFLSDTEGPSCAGDKTADLV